MNPALGLLADVSFGARLVGEFDALLQISPLWLAVWLAFVLALASMIGWAGPGAVRLAWRLGMDPRRRLGLAASALRVLGLLIGVAGVLRPVFVRAPTLGVSTLALLLALAALVAPTQLRNLSSGLTLLTRSRLREGDLVTVGDVEGTVRDIGLLRIGLRTAAGGVTHIPAADFDRLAVTVGSRRAAVPVEAEAVVGPHFDEQALEGLRRALWLCVYRRADTDVVIDYEVHSGRIVVRMDTWAQLAVAEVERHVRGLLLARIGGRPEATTEAKTETNAQPGDTRS